MYRLTRALVSLHLRSRLTTPTTTKTTPLFRLNLPLRFLSRRAIDPSVLKPIAGVDKFFHKGKVDHNQTAYDDSLTKSREKYNCGESESNGNRNYNERNVLPPDFSRNTVKLTCESTAVGGICDVYLVGTSHVSKESCQEVQDVVNFLKPQVVFLELCSSRVRVLKIRTLKVPTMGEMLEMLKKNQNLFAILYSWFLSKAASKLEVLPGAEFRVAYEEARKYGGKVVLGDRPVQITLARAWAKMPLWHKTKLLFSLLLQSFFLPSPEALNRKKQMDDVDRSTLAIQKMSKQFPTLMKTLVCERDQYMSVMLLKVAREHNSVVAVVGKGHMLGIQKYWKQPVELKELLSIPSKK